jgi:hypothetical protein
VCFIVRSLKLSNVGRLLNEWPTIYYPVLLRASEGTLRRWSRLHLQSLAPTNPHWALVVGYSPLSLRVIHKEDLCPSSGSINRLMKCTCWSQTNTFPHVKFWCFFVLPNLYKVFNGFSKFEKVVWRTFEEFLAGGTWLGTQPPVLWLSCPINTPVGYHRLLYVLTAATSLSVKLFHVLNATINIKDIYVCAEETIKLVVYIRPWRLKR